MDTLADFIKFKDIYFSDGPIAFEEGVSFRKIKFATNSFKGFLSNAKRKMTQIRNEAIQKIGEKAEDKLERRVDDVVMTANAYADYDVSKINLQNAINRLQIQNIKLAVYDFAMKRLETVSTPKQAKLNGRFVERIRMSFLEFKKTIGNTIDKNAQIRQDIFSAIKDKNTDNLQSIVDGTEKYTAPVVEEEPVKSSQPYGMTDDDMKNLTNLFNGFANGTLDVQNGVVVSTKAEEKKEEPTFPETAEVKSSSIDKDEVMDLKVQNSELRTRNRGLNDKNLELSQKLVSAESKIASLEDKINKTSDLEGKNKMLESQLNDSKLTISGLSSQVSDLEKSNKESFMRAQVAEEELKRVKADFEVERQQMKEAMEARIRAGVEIAMQQVMGNVYESAPTAAPVKESEGKVM